MSTNKRSAELARIVNLPLLTYQCYWQSLSGPNARNLSHTALYDGHFGGASFSPPSRLSWRACPAFRGESGDVDLKLLWGLWQPVNNWKHSESNRRGEIWVLNWRGHYTALQSERACSVLIKILKMSTGLWRIQELYTNTLYGWLMYLRGISFEKFRFSLQRSLHQNVIDPKSRSLQEAHSHKLLQVAAGKNGVIREGSLYVSQASVRWGLQVH